MNRRAPLAALVVTYQSAADVGAALASIAGQAPPGTPIVVVDEASTDGSPGAVRAACPEAILVVERENRGFAAGVQRAAAVCPAERYLLLNPDAWLEEGALEALGAALDRHPGFGGASPLVLRPEPDGRIDSLGLGLSSSLAPRSIACGRPGSEAPGRGEVFGFHGAAALLAAPVLEALGGFDARFFCYQEEFDLSWRARRAGWRFLAEPAARVRHRVAASSHGRNAWREYQLERNRIWAIARNASARELAIALPALAAEEVSSWRYALGAPAPWIVRARRDALRGMGRMMRGTRGPRGVARVWMGVCDPVPIPP